jgi:ubiquinone/menaquinone biosynthesis C-methylase UbiE
VTYRLASKFYDLFCSKNDLAFYGDLARQSGTEALELGVGTARVAIFLAKMGVRVLGLDTSPHMLTVAHKKLEKESEAVQDRVTLQEGDMRNFELNQSFSFIYLPASTFDHNLTIEDRKRTLHCVYAHLKKGGRFAFDLVQTLPEKPDASWWIDRREVPGGRMVVRSIFKRRNRLKQFLSLDLFFDVYEQGRLFERYHEYGVTAILSRDEVLELLGEVGFRVSNVYGDFDRSEYQQDSPRMVVVTTRH